MKKPKGTGPKKSKKPGGRAAERLRQFELERGLEPDDLGLGEATQQPQENEAADQEPSAGEVVEPAEGDEDDSELEKEEGQPGGEHAKPQSEGG
jgi:hypothetical protein